MSDNTGPNKIASDKVASNTIESDKIELDGIERSSFSRRKFLKNAGAVSVAGATATTLVGCGNSASPDLNQSTPVATTPPNNPVVNPPTDPGTDPTPPPPQAQSGTWVYEPDLFRLTLNLGDVTLGDGTAAGSCDITAESKTFKIRGLFNDGMFWAVPADDGTLFLQQWTRVPATTGDNPTMAGTYVNAQGFTLTLNADGSTNIMMTSNCAGYGYLGHTALENNIFRQGVAAGDPTSQGFIAWTRAEQTGANVSVNLEVATDSEFNNILSAGAGYTTDLTFPVTTTGGDDDEATHDNHIIKTVISGLNEDSTYFYRFVTTNSNDSAGVPFVSIYGRAKTLPSGTTTPSDLRVALASCSSFPHGFFNAYRQIARHDDLDGVFHLGDYTYEYPGEAGMAPGNPHDYPEDPAERVRQYSDDNREETIGLGSYRRRFRNYREDIDLQLVHSRYWFINTWDDHETTNDSFDPDLAGPEGGAENHNDIMDFPEGDWEDRKAAASQAYNEWHPISDIRQNAAGFNDPRLNRKFRYGTLADFIILDTRIQGRNPVNIDNDSYTEANRGSDISDDRKFMSDDQRDFMLQALSQAQTDGIQWKLLGQQVMMGQLIGPQLISGTYDSPNMDTDPTWASVINSDQWDGFDAERQTIFEHINDADNPIDNFVVLTGDIHTSWAIELVDDARQRAVPPVGFVNAGGTISGPVPVGTPTGVQERFGVEFVTTSITSPGLADPGPIATAIETNNPHIQRVDLNNRGYSILQLNAAEARCTWYHIESITDQENEVVDRAFAFKVDDGNKTLEEVQDD